MQIAFATWKFPALANTFILNEIVEVKKRGHDVSIWSIDRSDDEVVHEDVGAHRLLDRTFFLEDVIERRSTRSVEPYREDWLNDKVRALRPMAKELRRQGVDIVHGCFANNSATVAMAAARLAGIPFTFECHAHDLFVDLRFGEEKVREAAGIFSISDYNRRFLTDELGCSAEKIHIRRVPILADFCDTIERGGKDPELIVTVCRLHPIKGLADAIGAFERIASKHPNARFEIIGDGELRGELEAQAKASACGDRITFLGSLTNQETLTRVAKAGIFLLPSVIDEHGDRDGIPTSMIESMYLETPAVSTRVSGIPELIDHEVNGLLSAAGDVEAIAQNLDRLLTRAELAQEYGRKGREKVKAEFDVGRNIDVLLDNWQRIAALPRPTGRLGWLKRLVSPSR